MEQNKSPCVSTLLGILTFTQTNASTALVDDPSVDVKLKIATPTDDRKRLKKGEFKVFVQSQLSDRKPGDWMPTPTHI